EIPALSSPSVDEILALFLRPIAEIPFLSRPADGATPVPFPPTPPTDAAIHRWSFPLHGAWLPTAAAVVLWLPASFQSVAVVPLLCPDKQPAGRLTGRVRGGILVR